jgi:adenylate cyclase
VWSDGAEYAAIAIAGGLVIAGVAGLGAAGGLACLILALAALGGGSWTLFARQSLFLDATYPAFAALALYLSLTVVGYVRERRQKQAVRGAFAHYLAPALVEKLADNPESLRIGGEMKPMTVLFSDIRGFTGIAEGLRHDPAGLTRLINLYFTAMSDRLLEYGATIDKYMGDAVMAFWNAPLDDADHAADACRAGLEMLDGLAKLNRKLQAQGTGVSLDIGIGINTGECLVGNIGSEHRFNYSVIGDAVNVASRVEGLCKVYGTRILIGEATRAMAPGFATIEVDRIRARGRMGTTSVHALLGQVDLVADPTFQALESAQRRVLEAYRAQDFAEAAARLATLRGAISAFDGHGSRGAADLGRLCDVYADRLERLRERPRAPDWDGVFGDP